MKNTLKSGLLALAITILYAVSNGALAISANKANDIQMSAQTSKADSAPIASKRSGCPRGCHTCQGHGCCCRSHKS